MAKAFSFILFFLVCLACSKAVERDYVITNLSVLLKSYCIVDFRKTTDEAIDPKKYDCALRVNEFNQQQAIMLRNLFSQFTQGKMDEDTLLRSVLDIRFRNINYFQRHQGFKFDMKYNPFPGIQIAPGAILTASNIQIGNISLLDNGYVKFLTGSKSDGVLLRFLSTDDEQAYDEFGRALAGYEKSKDPVIHYTFVPLVNDNLYVLTQVILGIFSLCQLHHLSYETLDYIRASKSLWPLLGKVAQGADPFLLDDDVSLFENKSLINEYELYATCVLQATDVKMTFKGLGWKPRKNDIEIVRPGCLKDSGAILGDWSLPELPETLSKFDVPQALRLHLPSPVQQAEVVTKSADKVEEALIPEAGESVSSSELKPADVISGSPDESTDEYIFDLPNKKRVPNKGKGKGKDKRQELSSSSPSTSTVPDTQATTEHVPARWNRILHAQRNFTNIPLRSEPVAPTQLRVLEDIFDMSTTITYGVFESLWFHLVNTNSIKSAHKKSHRRLLDSQGRVVGGTFALHGSRTQYSDDNKRELQDALTLIGCGRAYLASLENK
jgi:hypothetical protein